MKMGTVSNSIFHTLGKNRGQVKISIEDAKWHAAAMDAINHMGNPGDWGVICDAYFEKCNNVSAMIGFVAGVTVVGAAIGIKKAVYSSGGHRGKKTRLVSRRRVSFKYLLKRGG